MDLQKKLQQYFSQDYRGGDSFINVVILPVFGEDIFTACSENLLEDDEELAKAATNCNVVDIHRIGTIDIP